MKLCFAIILLFTGVAAGLMPDKESVWELNRNTSQLNFSVNRVILSPVKGHVRLFSVTMTNTSEDFNDAQIEMSAVANSITTGVPKRDADLKSPNFFDVKKFPVIHFKSTLVRRQREKEYLIGGTLTMHGQSRFISFPAKLTEFNGVTASFEFSSKLNRMDYGIGKGTNSSLVSKSVLVSGKLQFIKKSQEGKIN